MTRTLPLGWQDIRKAVLLADGFYCRHCCLSPAEIVTRVNPAGPYEPGNLVSLCPPCKGIHDFNIRAATNDPHLRREFTKPVHRPARFTPTGDST